MRRIISGAAWLALLAAVALAMAGCTHLSYDPQTHRVSYWQALQNKTVQVQTPDGVTITYSSDNTPIIVLSDAARALAGKAVK